MKCHDTYDQEYLLGIDRVEMLDMKMIIAIQNAISCHDKYQTKQNAPYNSPCCQTDTTKEFS